MANSNSRVWVLGADDPEMSTIEALLIACGETVVYCMSGKERAHSGEVYGQPPRPGGMGTPVYCTIPYSCHSGDRDNPTTIYYIECSPMPYGEQGEMLANVPWEYEERIIDHHRHGDPGFGVPPADFFRGSSIGQVCAVLGLAILYSHRDDSCRILSDCEGQDGWCYEWSGVGDIPASDGGVFATVRDGAQQWPTGKHGMWEGLPLPSWAASLEIDARDVLFAAAADHCLGAAYAGQCPGVDVAEFGEWRIATRSAHQGRSVAEVRADVACAQALLESRRTTDVVYLDPSACDDPACPCCDGPTAIDMRGEEIPELPEAACRLGVAYLATPKPGPDGRRKVVLQCASAEHLAAWPAWAAANGIVDCYGGDPARGFAGGYYA